MDTEEKQTDSAQGMQRTRARRTINKLHLSVIVVVSLISGALLILLWIALLTPAQNQANGSSNGGMQMSSPLDGHLAPDFTDALLSAHGASKVHLSSFKGKPIVLNFWASWCNPCKSEAPLLQAAWKRVQAQEVIFIGVNYEDQQTDALNFLQTYGITYQNVVDPNGATAIDYGVSGVPETVFIDRRGVVVHKVIGQLTEQTLQSNLQKILRP